MYLPLLNVSSNPHFKELVPTILTTFPLDAVPIKLSKVAQQGDMGVSIDVFLFLPLAGRSGLTKPSKMAWPGSMVLGVGSAQISAARTYIHQRAQ